MREKTILVIGAYSNFGTQLIASLEEKYGKGKVIAADLPSFNPGYSKYMQLDVLNRIQLEKVVNEYFVKQIYLLSGMSAHESDCNMEHVWNLNMQSLISVLEIAKDQQLEQVFWPSSFTVFGPGSRKCSCSQTDDFEPNTVYGVSKRVGEYWCNYYYEEYGVDVRSLRFPGLISSAIVPGEELTDYVIDIFHQVLEHQRYTCFLEDDTCLPMVYMDDAVRASIELMGVPRSKISVHSSYNLAAMSFAPRDLAAAIHLYFPQFEISYIPDHRQWIADSLPAALNDEPARKDWGWKPAFGLKEMVQDMFGKFRTSKGIKVVENLKMLNGL